jgi:hypothetical protein
VHNGFRAIPVTPVIPVTPKDKEFVNQHPLLLVAKQKMKIGDEGKATEAAT